MRTARLIELSGTDGAGKTTALKFFVDQIKAKGFKVLETREVGNPHIPICMKLRELVLDPNSHLDGAEMELIFAAMRLRSHRMYRDVSCEYDFIISDRGYLEHLSYGDNNANEAFIDKLYLNLVEEITRMPDAVIYLDVDTRTALERRVKRGETMDVIELKGI